MLRFAARRLMLLAVTLAVASVLVFALTDLIPGDVGRIVLGPFAPQEAVDNLNRELGADRPLVERYAAWIAGIAQGDWGRSHAFDAPVLPLVAERLGRSLAMAGAALAVVVPASLLAGIVAARREGGPADRILTVFGLAVGALPEFVTGVFLILVFGLWLKALPIQALPPEGAGPLETLAHLALPVACLAILMFAYLFRMTRASVIEALAADYTRTAVLKGLDSRTVMRRHVLRNALPPTLAVIGAQVGWLVGGLVVVETLFKYPGIGSLMHFAATNKDLPLLVGCAIAVTGVFAVGNLVADLLHAALDPRLAHGDQG
jgi:peptide/nickel transport system permease protein